MCPKMERVIPRTHNRDGHSLTFQGLHFDLKMMQWTHLTVGTAKSFSL